MEQKKQEEKKQTDAPKMRPSGYDAKAIEQKWMEFWLENRIFAFPKNLSGKKIFSIDTPPPYPSGDFHAGNILNWCYFDFVARFKRMQGFAVHFPQGWDVHGLPTESKVEKWKGKKSSEVPSDVWYQWCEEWTAEHIERMRNDINKLGISCDWSFEYKTSDPDYIKMIQLSFLKLVEKSCAYRGKHPVNWCTNCCTAIADAEVEYTKRTTKLYNIKFQLAGEGEITIATTRPEYLPACVAVMVHPDDERYKKIIGRRAIVPIFAQEVEIFASDAVDPEFGTGIVMICTFGDKEDVAWVFKYGLPIVDALDEKGRMTDAAGKYSRMKAPEARKSIVSDLNDLGYLLKDEQIPQRTGVCWRCKNPIEIMNKEQWFLRATQFKEKVIHETNKCKWWPNHMKIHQIQWAQSMDWDWVVSRQKVYGTPIPVWYCKNNECAEIIVADEKELPVDPVKNEKTCPKCNSPCKGETDRFDTWIDSSMTTYWHAGWPNNKHGFDWKKLIPATLQPNGMDIIRTWDYYLMLRSLMLTELPAYENVLINGMVLGEDGKKMSKSLGNFVTGADIFEKSYADAVRYWAATGATGSDLPFSWKEVKHAEKFYNKLYNIFQFLIIHLENFEKEPSEQREQESLLRGERNERGRNAAKIKNIDQFINYDIKTLEPLDKWILSKTQKLVAEITDDFEHYNFSIIKIEEFLWHEFADYYMEMVKHRLYGAHKKEQAIWTLYNVLFTLTKLMAPFAPYITEELYQQLFEKTDSKLSIHLCEWPIVNETLINEHAEEQGKLAKDVISAIRQHKTNNKMPLNAPIKEVIIERDDIIPLIEDLKGVLKIENLVSGKVEREDIITKKFGIKIDVSL